MTDPLDSLTDLMNTDTPGFQSEWLALNVTESLLATAYNKYTTQISECEHHEWYDEIFLNTLANAGVKERTLNYDPSQLTLRQIATLAYFHSLKVNVTFEELN